MSRTADMAAAVLACEWGRVLDAVASDVGPHRGAGRVADYIPALARVDPGHFGMCLATRDGEQAGVGDARVPFSIQSISKVFGLTLALRCRGEALWERLGREPSGSAFNSVVQLESERGVPRNPFINAGALVVTDVLVSEFGAAGALEAMVSTLRELSGNPAIAVDEEVAASEAETGHRNRSLAHFMKSFGRIENDVDEVLDVYFRQCALAMSCEDLARASLWLANDGRAPGRDEPFVSQTLARRINAIMLTCGHYDAAGDFAYRVGLPGKSGVGGGIIVVVPDRLCVAVWSPGLDASGNSKVGTLALEAFVEHTGLAIF